MKIADRMNTLKPSATLQLNARARQLKKEGKPLISFAVGEPDYNTPQKIVDQCKKSLDDGRTKYGAAGGSVELRQAIAEKLKRENGLTFTPEQIICGIGAKEILFHTLMCMVNPGDEVILPSPFWVSYEEQVRVCGGVPKIIPIHENFPDTYLKVEDIAKYATEKTVAIMLNSPNNPSGHIFSKSFMQELASYLKTKNWWIISDEIYEYMAFDAPHYSLIEFEPSLIDRYIHINGFSKSFAMTGWRVGYAAAPKAFAEPLRNLQSQSSTALPMFIDDSCIVAINEGRSLMNKELEVLKKRRDLMLSALAKDPDIRFVKPQGAFYTFVDIRKQLDKKNMSSLEFSELLLTKYYVACAPGESFGAPGFIRFSYATSEKAIEEGVERFLRAVKEICA